MNDHRFILEPYKGIGTRHTCPKCNNKRCLSRYIDTEKQIEFPSYVGRCDREQKCTYHFTPHDYFEQNPFEKDRYASQRTFAPTKKGYAKPIETSYIETSLMENSLKLYSNNRLYQFLSSQFGDDKTMGLMRKYKVGTSKYWNGATVFWQIDNNNQIRTGKIMLYNPLDGKRIKVPHNHITWVHSLLNIKDFNLQQCFFGEHLLQQDKNKPIALVESEKTALVASYYLPQYLWIASGGKNGCFKTQNLSVLKERDVILFPDLGATSYWQDKMLLMESIGIKAQLFDYLETHASEQDRKEGYDIADYLLKVKPDEAILQAMIKKNINLKMLIEAFDLKLVKAEYRPFSTKIHTQKKRGFRL